jgi:hypothetical protein
VVEDIITVLVIMPALAVKAGADAGTGIWATAGIAVLARAREEAVPAPCATTKPRPRWRSYCAHLKAGGATGSKTASG